MRTRAEPWACALGQPCSRIDIRGNYCGYEEYPYAIDFIASKRVELKSLISDAVPLDQLVENVFEILVKPRTEALKIIAKISWFWRRIS